MTHPEENPMAVTEATAPAAGAVTRNHIQDDELTGE